MNSARGITPSPTSLSQNSTSFHLERQLISDMYVCDTDSIASSSMTAKQRIDSIFDESRSEYNIPNSRSYYEPRKVKSLIENEVSENFEKNVVAAKNPVQIRIDEMFKEIYSAQPKSRKFKEFSCKYLGSAKVASKVNSIRGIQTPIKDLFFDYKRKQRNKPEEVNNCFLKITEDSLIITRISTSTKKKIVKLYPFTRVSVWASVKLVCRKTDIENMEFAFTPLISESADNKNSAIFRKLAASDLDYIFDDKNEIDDSPIFAVIVKDVDTPRQLLCQGFMCQSANDAIIIAAELYKMLTTHMDKKKINGRRKNINNIGRKLSSIGEIMENQEHKIISETPPPLPPKVPPRKPKNSIHSEKDENNLFVIKPLIENFDDNRGKIFDESFERPSNRHKCLGRTTSNESKSSNFGDILTKVAIPRSSGVLNRSKNFRERGEHSRLGFYELFDELRTQEGLKSIDEILNVIINVDGMSFNNLKPIYKEFLLKLATVLTKDEIYHRSKTIMRIQKKRRKKKLSRNPKRNALSSFCTRQFRKIWPVKKKKRKSERRKTRGLKKRISENVDSTSTDSFLVGSRYQPEFSEFSFKCENRRDKQNKYQINDKSKNKLTKYSLPCKKFNIRSSENNLNNTLFHQSSSGYFSCSECSYDTDTCTCTSAEKCYCSLGKNNCLRDDSITSCDTNKCRRNVDKCYCSKAKNQNDYRVECSKNNLFKKTNKEKLLALSLVDELKMRGFALSETSSIESNKVEKVHLQRPSRMRLYEGYDFASAEYRCRKKSLSKLRSSGKYENSNNWKLDYSLFTKSENQSNKNRTSNNNNNSQPKIVYAEIARNYAHCSNKGPNVVITNNVSQCNCACKCGCVKSSSSPDMRIQSKRSSFDTNLERSLGYLP